MAFAALTIDLNARLAKFEDDMARVRKSMGGLEKSAGVLKAGLGGIFAGVGVAGLAAFAKNGIDAADALKDMSDRLGVSVRDLASFKLAAEQSGTELEGVGKGIARLTRSIGEAEGGNKKLGEALKALGITARDPKEAFFQLADATEKIQDPSKRAALLAQVLGKSYQDLIPLLSQGSDELRKSAKESESFAESMARLAPEADKFNDNLAKLKINAAGLSGELLTKLVPALNEIFERITLVKNLIGAGGLFGTLQITAGTGEISTVMRRLKDDIKTTQEVIAGEKAKGKDAGPFEEKLRRLNAQLVVMKEHSRAAALALGEQFKDYKVPKSPLANAKISTPATGTKSTKAATDPLASLLSQTDTAKFAEYTKLQDLLNARFERGAITGKQYAEALTVLRKGYFTEELKAFADQLEYNAETERLAAEHLKGTTDALREQSLAWSEAGAALTDEMRTPLENANIEFARLQDLLDRGAISWETYSRAVFKASESLDDIPKKADDMKEAFRDAFAQMTNGLAQFVSTGKLDFQSLIKSMLEGLARVAANKALNGLLKTAKSATGGSGFWFSILDAVTANAKGNVFNSAGLSAFSGSIVSKPTVFPFAKGIGLMGEAGAEAILPLKRGKDGKLGVASTGGSGGVMINVSVDATGSKVEGDQGKSGEFGRMIGNAVRGVLIQEMRPGGMLA